MGKGSSIGEVISIKAILVRIANKAQELCSGVMGIVWKVNGKITRWMVVLILNTMMVPTIEVIWFRIKKMVMESIIRT